MTQNAPKSPAPWIEYALLKTAWPEERALALLLFDYLTEPRAIPGRSFALPSRSRVEIKLRGDQRWLGEAWKQVFVPHLTTAAHEAIVITDRQLRRAHQLLTAAGAARPEWDPMCFSRSAIEPHPQNSMPEAADVLIDAARDCLESLLAANRDAGNAYTQSWAEAEAPLLRRLAVHGWTHRADVDASAKLAWLRSRGWLFDHQLRHEVFTLIAATINDADPSIADTLVAEAAAGPVGSQHQEYEAYSALAWITRHAPALDSARKAFGRAQERHPEFAERSHPDLTSWIEFGWARPQPPMSTGELRSLIEDDPVAAITELRTRPSQPEGPGWDDALDLLSDTVRERASVGLAVLDADGGTATDVLSAVIRGWSAATLRDADAQEIIDQLSSIDLSTLYTDVARMLAGSGRSESTPTEWHRIPAARLLATKVWAIIPTTSSDRDADRWLARAIGHPAGQLAQFWTRAVASDWHTADDSWSGLAEIIRSQLEAMLTSNDERSMMAEIVFASQLHFFHAADAGWCLDHVLPLLNWADPVRARRTWDGFLSWGRFDNQLLEAGLRDQYVQAAERIDEFPDDLRRQLYRHLSAVALRNPDAATAKWARTLTATVDVPLRVAWMDYIGWDLSTLSAETVEQQWRAWMRTYWKDRLRSVPTRLTVEESSAMATWVIYLTDSLDEGVAEAIAAPAAITQHSGLLHNLTSERIRQAPSAIAKLVGHLLQGTQRPFFECHEIQRIVHEVGDIPEAEAIREQALRLGCLLWSAAALT